MKDYRWGILKHDCSKRMRIGKRIKVYQHTSKEKKCPNCGNMMCKVRMLKKIKKKIKKIA